ncbi:MAG: DUF1269 domain-containing protein [Mycobacteriaceae bacterium]|uniref:DUF1269 domain-containing protein n=1 Tax=Corynebacterium sp. TaxID=1720 RepID=UPI003F9BD545
MTENIAVVTFPDTSDAYQAFSALKTDPVGYAVDSAGIVERDENGGIRIPEGYSAEAGSGVGKGSLIGMLVGVLGGPLGVLLGWGLGASIGALTDSDKAEDVSSALQQFGRRVPTGKNALVLQTDEETTGGLDNFVERYNGDIVRRPVSDVLAEVEAAEQASRKASEAAEEALKEQRKREREGHREERKQERQERIEQLKAKFA